jgi:hypothetical protein
MRIKRFEEFSTNEGIGGRLSTLALLAGLGLATPKQSMGSKDTANAEIAIGKDEQDILSLVSSSDELLDSLKSGEKKSALVLERELEKFKNANKGIDLKIGDLIKAMQKPSFPINICLFGYNIEGDEDAISTIGYRLNPKVTFTLTKNPLWGTHLYGMKLSF